MTNPGKIPFFQFLPVISVLLMMLVLLSVGMTGCASWPEGTDSLVTSGATRASSAGSSGTKASGALRLWWSRRQNLNPLLDSSQSGLAINSLIYEGLFQIDASQQIQLQLAEQMTVAEDGLQVMIKLRPGLTFHDGRALQAADVAACLKFIQANGARSSYAAALSGINAAEASDTQTIRLTLGQPDPWLAWSLVFPVIPAASLNGGPFVLVQGTGPFRMLSYEAAAGLTLGKARPTDDPNELRTIRVIEYASPTAAMQAFAADELDLVSLSADEYSRYLLRGNLRFEPYLGSQMLFLAYNTQKRRPLADSGRLLYLKQKLEPDNLAAAGAGVWGECTAIGLPAASWMLDSHPPDHRRILDSIGQPAWNSPSRDLVLLLPSGDAFRQTLAAILGSCLHAARVAWRQEVLPELEYETALIQGNYDLALLEAVLPAAPDAAWLYRDDRPAAYSLLSLLPNGGLADYDLWRQRLPQASRPDRDDASVGNFSEILGETAARSPWSVLLIRSAAILYGDRVVGQCRPDRYHPYRGIEELWIWSGQSS